MTCLLILSTAPTLQEARGLADILLKERLAACISISSPIESHYRWENKNQKDQEYMLFIKTTEVLFPKVEETLLRHHSYDTPEIIAFPVEKGSASYLTWIASETLQQ